MTAHLCREQPKDPQKGSCGFVQLQRSQAAKAKSEKLRYVPAEYDTDWMVTGTAMVVRPRPATAEVSSASVQVTSVAAEMVTARVCDTPLTASAVVPFAPPVESNRKVKPFVVPALTV